MTQRFRTNFHTFFLLTESSMAIQITFYFSPQRVKIPELGFVGTPAVRRIIMEPCAATVFTDVFQPTPHDSTRGDLCCLSSTQRIVAVIGRLKDTFEAATSVAHYSVIQRWVWRARCVF